MPVMQAEPRTKKTSDPAPAKVESTAKWGKGRVHQPDEESEHLWAAQELITPEEWAEVENATPGSLEQMAKRLDLPAAAAMWRARAERELRGQAMEGAVDLDDAAIAELSKPVNGQGGPQALLRRVQKSVEGTVLYLNRDDFDKIRENLERLQGGFRSRLVPIMESTLVAIEKAGGIHKFFRPISEIE